MRTFIAIELSPEIKDFLSRLQDKLKTSGADVKWIQPQNIHLTLKFLGEIDEKKLEKVTRVLEEVAKDKNAFYICLSGTGAFPTLNSPRVIWVGVDKGNKEAEDIAGALEEKLAKIGIRKESRPFSSHITIGRIRSALNRDNLTKNLTQAQEIFEKNKKLELAVKKITLFKSTLTPKGPIYEALKEISLK